MDEEEEIIKASIVYMNNEIDATFDDNKNHEDDKVCSFREIEIAFKEGAKYALENQWISVKDKLPDDKQKCLVHLKCGAILSSVYFSLSKYFMNDDANEADYWMPIPELNVSDSDDM